MTITDKIHALLSADPICGGRVTGETARAIADRIERLEVALRKIANRPQGAPDSALNVVSELALIAREALAFQHGDFGAGEG